MRRTRPLWRLHVLALFALGSGAAIARAQEPAPPAFDRDTVAAAGRQVAELRVATPGRYSIRAESKSGVSIRVIDRMSGWSAPAGAPGESDGRLDLFLDRGAVRVVTAGAKLARGEARLRVEPFVERHGGGGLPVLPEDRLIAESLGDLESASWWIEIKERRRLVVEAAGRSLADLRLWRDGAWLVADQPRLSVVTPEPQRPLALLELHADLEPGLYRLSAYGGMPQAWAKESAAQPFYLRLGIPRLPESGRSRRVVSPFGYDRYLVPGTADTLRLELPEPRAASLDVWTWDPTAPFPDLYEAARQEINKESLPPVAVFEAAPDARGRLVVVRGDAGQPYVLQQLHSVQPESALSGREGSFWLATLTAGAPADTLDQTGVLVRRHRDGRGEILASRAVPLSRSHGWARRFNLTTEATLHLDVQEPADYEILASGLAAQARLEPLRLSSSDKEPPRSRALPSSWSLPAGLYVLTLSSSEQGAMALAIRPRGLRDPLVDWVASGEAPPAAAAPRAAAQFGLVRFAARQATTLLSSQPGPRTGLILRPAPVDVEDALPVAVAPGEEVTVPIVARHAGRLAATADDGSRLELALDGGSWTEAAEVAPGEHGVRLRSPSPAPRIANLELVPRARLADAPPPVLAAEPSPKEPLPGLEIGASAAFNLGRGGARTFLIAPSEPALYRLETSGLLRTAGTLRTRVAPALAAAQENGSGRNFLLSAYLREGDYQLTAAALGESAGHAGLTLRRAALRDGGTLLDGLPARSWIQPDEALAYRLPIARDGRYALRADGLRGAFAVRLEDGDGWPVDVPASGPLQMDLEAGDYRLLVLPQAVPARAVVRLDRVQEPDQREGHGPYALALGETATHVWMEPAGEADRQPDRWRFELPAAATVEITLDAEMAAEIAPAAGGEPVAKVQPGRLFRGSLPAGEYVLAARCSRRNNRVPYSLRVRTDELVEGTAHEVSVPAELVVAIGHGGFYELESDGADDVRARVLGADGRVLQSSDDRPGDWNFLLARRLDPGRYTLRVDASGGERATTTVALRARAETTAKPLAAPGSTRFEAGSDQVLVPLELPQGADFLAATARSTDGLGLELERDGGDGWRALSRDQGSAVRVALALAPDGARYRLRLRALDRRPLDVALAAWAGAAPRVSERSLRSGAALRPLPGLSPQLAVAAVELREPGCFEILSAPVGLEQAIAEAEPLRPAGAALVSTGGTLWIAAPAGTGSATVSARRLHLGKDVSRAALTLAPAPLVCDLEPSSGPRWVKVATLGGGDPLAAIGFHNLPAATAVAPHEVLAIDAGGDAAAVRLWSSGTESPEARLETRAFTSPAREAAGWGALEIELTATAARRFILPPGEKNLRLSLGEGAAALLLSAARPLGALWAARGLVEERLNTRADEVLLVPTGESGARVRLEVLPAIAAGTAPRSDDGLALLVPGGRYEARFAHEQIERLAVAPGASGRLRVRGATQAALLGADGSFQRGSDLEPPAAGGTLLIEHGSGLVAAWLEPPRGDGPASWGFAELAAEPLSPPANLALSGPQRRFEIASAAPRLLHVRPTSALAAGLVGEGVAHFAALAEPAPFVAYLPAGRNLLLLRGLAGEPLAGNLEITAEPLEPLDEGLGQPTLLAAGGASGYGFHLAAARRVGIGVQADVAGVEAVVFDATGKRLGQAVAQWLDLPPGDYALALLAPRDGGPATARPALVGVSPPGDGPPSEVAAELLARLRGVETAAGATAFQPAPLPTLLGEDEPTRDTDEDSWDDEAIDDDDSGDSADSEDTEGEEE